MNDETAWQEYNQSFCLPFCLPRVYSVVKSDSWNKHNIPKRYLQGLSQGFLCFVLLTCHTTMFGLVFYDPHVAGRKI